jgi:hypothetical protein
MNKLNQTEDTSKIQKCLLDNPELPIDFIKDVITSKNQDCLLSEIFFFEDKHE